jgi:hypothetical protein
MPSEFNKGRAQQFYNSLNADQSVEAWIKLFASILGFLLARYIDGK